MVGLLDHLGAGPVVVCGLSLGAMVSLQMVIDQPNRVASIIVANSRSSFTGPENTAMVDAACKTGDPYGNLGRAGTA